MAVHFIRTIIMYFFIIGVFRMMGKRQIGELQSSELVVAIIISEIAAVPIQDSSSSLLISLMAITVLLICEISLSYTSIKSRRLRKLFYGAPSILIENGIINQKELKKQRYNISDLMEEMRNKGIASIGDVDFLVVETNGQVSIIPKPNTRPVTPDDLKINVPKTSLSYIIIDDGKIIDQNIKILGFNSSWLHSQITKQNINSPKDIFYMSATREGEVFIFPQNTR